MSEVSLTDIENALSTLDKVCKETMSHAGCNRCVLFEFCHQKEKGGSISYSHVWFKQELKYMGVELE